MRKPSPSHLIAGRPVLRSFSTVILLAASCPLLTAQNSPSATPAPADYLSVTASPRQPFAVPAFTAPSFAAPSFAPPPFAAPPNSIFSSAQPYTPAYTDLFQPDAVAAAFADGQPGPEFADNHGADGRSRRTRRGLLFAAPRVSSLAPGRQDNTNPFGPRFGDQPSGPAPLFPIRGALGQPAQAPLSFTALMHGVSPASGAAFRFPRQTTLLPGTIFAEPPRPTAATMFGAADLGNGMIFSAGSGYGSRAAGAPAASLGSTSTAAQKHGGPSVAFKLSF